MMSQSQCRSEASNTGTVMTMRWARVNGPVAEIVVIYFAGRASASESDDL